MRFTWRLHIFSSMVSRTPFWGFPGAFTAPLWLRKGEHCFWEGHQLSFRLASLYLPHVCSVVCQQYFDVPWCGFSVLDFEQTYESNSYLQDTVGTCRYVAWFEIDNGGSQDNRSQICFLKASMTERWSMLQAWFQQADPRPLLHGHAQRPAAHLPHSSPFASCFRVDTAE